MKAPAQRSVSEVGAGDGALTGVVVVVAVAVVVAAGGASGCAGASPAAQAASSNAANSALTLSARSVRATASSLLPGRDKLPAVRRSNSGARPAGCARR